MSCRNRTRRNRRTTPGSICRWLLLAAILSFSATAIASVANRDTAPTVAAATPTHPDVPAGESCNSCHAPRQVPTVDPAALAHSVHAKLDCTDCHSGINAIPHPKQLPAVDCSACHRRVAREIQTGMHAAGRSARNAPGCITCHGTHDIQHTDSVAFRNSIPDRCAVCHKAHYQGYMDRFHGQAATLGMASAPRCSDCHDPHRPLPQSDPASRIAPANLVTTCGKCHTNANRNFTEFDPHPQPWNRTHSALVYYCHLLMVLLLAGVFGFFGLHTALWLQRSFVAQIRHELPRPVIREPAQYILRFTLFERWMHIIVIVTFMLLALTGLPLMYASAPWARLLSRLLGGEPIMRFIHIASGMVTFGYFFTHIGVVVYRFVRTRDWHLFYGVNSMVPTGKDIADIVRNFAWFLYLGPRPKLDRWTYWEKFDYWAVFWGVAMIGVSGLMLMAPQTAAQLLPGEFLNVAAVIHGEEALLAVGFIFVFHYFHNHLRPENFPMDITIFTGRLPLERFREERPLQYKRLVEQGRLESLLVGPPSRMTVAASTVFGAVVVLLGLALIIAVFATLLLPPGP